MPNSLKVPLLIRAIIIAYRFQMQLSYREIANKLSLNWSTVQMLCIRVYNEAQSDELHKLLLYIDTRPGRGRKKQIEPGSAESKAIRELVRTAYKYYEPQEAVNHAAKSTVLQELHPNIKKVSRPQAFEILRNPEHCRLDTIDKRPIKRKRELLKPGGYNAAKRLKYTEEMDSFVIDEVILVVCDEKKFGFGGSANNHVNLPEGEESYGLAQPVRFVREQWAAATGQDVSVTRPHRVWSADDHRVFKLAQKLAAANAQARQVVDQQRWRAQNDPQSTEHQMLKKANAKVKAENTANSMDKDATKKQLWTAARFFPYRDIKQGSTRKVNAIWYAFRIYEDLLFPYISKLRDLYPYRKVIVIEDNHKVHLKARKLVRPSITELNIEFASHTAFSPDLNTIETLHREQDKLLEPFKYSFTSKSKEDHRQADEKLKEIWQSNHFDQFVLKYCSLEAIHDLSDKVKAAQGHNNFQDQ
jgi:hypothetical protein